MANSKVDLLKLFSTIPSLTCLTGLTVKTTFKLGLKILSLLRTKLKDSTISATSNILLINLPVQHFHHSDVFRAKKILNKMLIIILL